jgi:hypothetical protein
VNRNVTRAEPVVMVSIADEDEEEATEMLVPFKLPLTPV